MIGFNSPIIFFALKEFLILFEYGIIIMVNL